MGGGFFISFKRQEKEGVSCGSDAILEKKKKSLEKVLKMLWRTLKPKTVMSSDIKLHYSSKIKEYLNYAAPVSNPFHFVPAVSLDKHRFAYQPEQ